MLARFNTDILDPDARPERLARELEARKSDARKLGGDVLAYTDETDVVATVA
ncbi:MAG: hypothetical protein GWN85_19815, partial [Gemmatimonadetes bacterium]|nr:hypothetical protein [Gemmatimonadota bacterium]NIS32459.1 hypothetical protein [Actinomycetota bacterium]NIU67479.1 hypothetical protein [Actinomycetota bacterium]NIW29253.1 hypothetical protein [Actinomycetota bacterium]